MATLVTLSSDFGTKDPDLSVLKSLIINKLPKVNLIDISHDITPFDAEEAIYIIKNSLQNFAKNTIHFVAVDSQVTQEQPPLLLVANEQFFLTNDNGIVATAFQDMSPRCYKLPVLKSSRMMEEQLKAATLLVAGSNPNDFAVEISQPQQILLPKPQVSYKEKSNIVKVITTKVIYNDHYQNAIFNLTKNEFDTYAKGRKFTIRTRHYSIEKITDNYEVIQASNNLSPAGLIGARFNDFGYLEIFNFQSNQDFGGAQSILGLVKGSIINIVFA